jgi:orotate phosphoribosyltransferase
MAALDKLKDMVRKHALEIKPEGEFFTLKSGEKSRYYLDCRNLNLTPEGLHSVVTAMMERLNVDCMAGLRYDAIGGPSLGADPIVGGMIFMTGMMTLTKTRGFLIRKESKEYGKGGRVVGPLKPGDRCLIIEDVTTTGSSALDAVQVVEDFGAKVVHVYSIVDRLAGGAEAFKVKNIPFTPLLTVKDFGL